MATKPTIANARWGETAAGVVGGNDTAPSSGQRDTGWTTNQVAVSSFFNRILRELYLWCKYLSDGALTGNHSISGTLDVGSTLTVSNGGMEVSGSLETSVFDGSIDVGGNVNVGSNATVDGDHTVSGRIYEAAPRWRKIPACAGKGLNAAQTDVAGEYGSQGSIWFPTGATDVFFVPIVLEEGEDLLQVSAAIECSTTGGVVMAVFRNDGTGLTGSEGTDSANNSGEQNLLVAITQATEPVDDAAYNIRFTFTTTSGVAINSIRIQISRPAP